MTHYSPGLPSQLKKKKQQTDEESQLNKRLTRQAIDNLVSFIRSQLEWIVVNVFLFAKGVCSWVSDFLGSQSTLIGEDGQLSNRHLEWATSIGLVNLQLFTK